MKHVLAVLALCLLTGIAHAGGPDSKPVLILLRDQPHRQMLRQVEELYGADLRAAQSEYDQAPPARSVPARQRLDATLLRVRREFNARIAARLRPRQDAMESFLTGLGATHIARFQTINALRADVPASALGALESYPDAAAVFPLASHAAELEHSVPGIGAPALWQAGWIGSGETVGVLDTGISPHPALNSVLAAPYFLASGSRQPGFADSPTAITDQDGHGTAVAGVIASAGSAQCSECLGMARQASVLNLKVGYRQQTGDSFDGANQWDDVISALDWALQNQPAVKVFNYSAGSRATADDDNESRMFDYLADVYGISIVASAGNRGKEIGGKPQLSSPGVGYNVISVANLDDHSTSDRSQATISPSSSRGPVAVSQRNKPDIAAPGTPISTTSMDGKSYVQESGTSIAAPHISGAAALLRQSGVSDSLSIKALLLNSPDGTGGWTQTLGWGYANLNTLAPLLQAAKTSGKPANLTASLPISTVSMPFQLYRGTAAAALKATLVWNRHFDSGLNPFPLTNLDVSAYPATQNQELISTYNGNPHMNNVKQLSVSSGGDIVLKVKANSAAPAGAPDEAFALAVSQAVFSPVSSAVQFGCSQTSSASSSSSEVDVVCTASITGGAVAFNVQASDDAGHQAFFANLDASTPSSASQNRTWIYTAPSGDPVTHTATLTYQEYGESLTTTTTFQVSGPGTPGNGGGGAVTRPSANALPAGFSHVAVARARRVGRKLCGPDQRRLCLADRHVLGRRDGVACAGRRAGIGELCHPAAAAGTGRESQCQRQARGPGRHAHDQRAWLLTQVVVVTLAQNPTNCTFSVSPTLNIPATGGGTNSLPVTATAGCGWSASVAGGNPVTGWITLQNSSGTGSGSVTFTAQDNPSSTPRTINILVAGKAATITQAGATCAYSLTPSSSPQLGWDSQLGGTIKVSAPGGCVWTATAGSSWIQILNGHSGSGQGTVAYAAGQNWNSIARSGAITVGGKTFAVTQAAAPGCPIAVAPASSAGHFVDSDASASTGVIQVVTPAGCHWTIGADPQFVTIGGARARTGNAKLTYTFKENATGADRQAVVQIGGQAVTFSQAPFLVAQREIDFPATANDTEYLEVDYPHQSTAWTAAITGAWLKEVREAVEDSPVKPGWYRALVVLNTSAANALPGSRTGYVTITTGPGHASVNVKIEQAGKP